MKRAIDLAYKGTREVFPNPKVGCVIVKDEKIIGEGYHQKFGQGHAEVQAIKSVKNKDDLVGAQVYVTLEPCSFFGKTPPCCDLLISHDIGELIVGAIDVNPKVSGKGLQKVKDAGIKVTQNILTDSCTRINKEFNTLQIKKRPFIILKWAESADGFIDRDRNLTEKPSRITNELVDIWVQKLRSEVHAIMVGTNTIIRDNPRLTQRYNNGQHPIRISFDNHLKLNNFYHFFDDNSEKVIFSNKSPELSAKILNYRESKIENAIDELGKEDIASILVEGGSELLNSFLKADLWDMVIKIRSNDLSLISGIKSPRFDYHVDEKIDFRDNSIWIHKKKGDA
jgi:diaminohydroxyphosphoribosylaminopyrimidine deaminase/5-amino-6-(5-phosphoribosylamino)uracil reductase